MCLYCLGRASAGLSRREMLQMGALGAALPFIAPAAAAESADFKRDIAALITRAHSGELVSYRVFEIDGDDLPWIDLGLAAAKGQQVSFLVTGRMWIARPYDLWFKPGLVFHARSRGKRPIYSPGVDTGTMTAAHDGPLEIARSAAQFADADGRLWTPEAEYRKQEVKILGVALVWKGEALAGLESLAASGDVDGLVAAEIARLKRGRKLPRRLERSLQSRRRRRGVRPRGEWRDRLRERRQRLHHRAPAAARLRHASQARLALEDRSASFGEAGGCAALSRLSLDRREIRGRAGPHLFLERRPADRKSVPLPARRLERGRNSYGRRIRARRGSESGGRWSATSPPITPPISAGRPRRSAIFGCWRSRPSSAVAAPAAMPTFASRRRMGR